jgi:flagellar hook-associated protein 1 FlgK
MPGLFGLYGLGGQSLVNFQSAMNAVSHNVANAATAGFHRQRVELEAGAPEVNALGAFGTGVRLGNIRRIEDRFLETALRREAPLLSRFGARASVLASAELAFGEPSEAGLATQLDDFFDGWDDLASAPEDLGARESILRLGDVLANSIRSAHSRLVDEQAALTAEMSSAVDDANRILREIDQLNETIVASTRRGTVAADLEDRRDSLVAALGDLIGVTAQVEEDGTATVRLGGRTIVQKAGSDQITLDQGQPRTLRFQGTELDASEVGGRLGGLVEARDEDIATAIRRLDEMAARLATDVNRIHRGGRDRRGDAAGEFFSLAGVGRDGVTGAAAVLRVDGALRADALRVAAGTDGTPGDGTIALDLAALRDDAEGAGAGLRALVADIGGRARESRDLADAQQVVVDSFQAQRDSVSAVSLDEEATELLRFQRSYQAAARIVTTVDEMAQTLLAM